MIEAQKDGETVRVELRPICENLGLSYGSQYNRLQRQPWAAISMMKTTGSDGTTYEMVALDRRTFTMWLATIDTSRVKSQSARDLIVAYQQEAADALDAYFSTGVAVNEHLLKAQHLRRLEQVELLKAAEGLVHPDFLEAKTRIVIAREMGETPELDPKTRPLYVAGLSAGEGPGPYWVEALCRAVRQGLEEAVSQGAWQGSGACGHHHRVRSDTQGQRVHGGRPSPLRPGVADRFDGSYQLTA